MLIRIETLISEIYISSAYCDALRSLKRRRLRAGKNKNIPTRVMKRGTRVGQEDASCVPILFSTRPGRLPFSVSLLVKSAPFRGAKTLAARLKFHGKKKNEIEEIKKKLKIQP